MRPEPLWVCPSADCTAEQAGEGFAGPDLVPVWCHDDRAAFRLGHRRYRVSLVLAAEGWRWAVFADEGEVPP